MGEKEYRKVARDIKKALLNRKEEFCKADYLSIKAAKTQLMTLVTKIMMEEAGFIIDEILKDCKRQTDLLKIKKDQYKYNLDVLTSENEELRRDADEAKKELVEALQEELKYDHNKDDKEETNALKILMQRVICLRSRKEPEP